MVMPNLDEWPRHRGRPPAQVIRPRQYGAGDAAEGDTINRDTYRVRDSSIPLGIAAHSAS